jgi:predicted small metal-binding protein
MKTMTCTQLGGACDKEFRANTFEEMAQLSQQHGMEMHQQQDAPHLEAMQKMQEPMKDPAKMQEWFESKKAEFDSLPED